jgi:uncharacterized membrane protein YdjX (TVP38/TMEM64 family)
MSKPSRPELILAGILGMGPMLGVFLGSALVASARTWPREPGFDILLWLTLGGGMFLGVVPSSLAALSVALRWGWAGFLPYLATMTFCATLFFVLVRRFASGSLRSRIESNPKLAPFIQVLDKRAFPLLLAIRLAPVLIYSWTNALFAISSLSLPRYVLGTLVGAIPRVVAGFAAGQAGLSIVQELRRGLVPGTDTWILLGGALVSIGILGFVGKTWIGSMRGKADEARSDA